MGLVLLRQANINWVIRQHIVHLKSGDLDRTLTNEGTTFYQDHLHTSKKRKSSITTILEGLPQCLYFIGLISSCIRYLSDVGNILHILRYPCRRRESLWWNTNKYFNLWNFIINCKSRLPSAILEDFLWSSTIFCLESALAKKLWCSTYGFWESDHFEIL